MSAATALAPTATPATYVGPGAYRITVAQYERMIAAGALGPADKVELLEGYLVPKLAGNPPHDGTLLRVQKRLTRVLPPGWDCRAQLALALPGSHPEPDLAVVREDPADYTTRHPNAADTGLVVEVADGSLPRDLRDKSRIYAASDIPVYWVVNVPGREIEVFTDPDSAAVPPAYRSRAVRRLGDAVPFDLDGVAVAAFDVADLIP